MRSSSSRLKGPQTGVTLPYKVLLLVVDYTTKTTTYYRVNSYKLLESLMKMPNTSGKINVADKAIEMKMREELKDFWLRGMTMTEDTTNPHFTYTLELG